MQPDPTPRRFNYADRGPLYIAVGAMIMGLALVLVFAYLLLAGDGEVVGPTPTPFAQSTLASIVEDDEEAVQLIGVSSAETISVTLPTPQTLNIAGTSFQLEAQTVLTDGVWSPQIAADDRGVWIDGTIINYVIALRDSVNNRELLQSLAPGDRITLQMEQGATFEFAFSSRELVAASNRDIFLQNQPGITIVLVGTPGNERMVVRGRYVIDEVAVAPTGGDGETGIELGETTQLGNLSLAVTGATHLSDRPEAPPGFDFYLLDFELQNLGESPFDTSQLNLALVDASGNQYVMNPVASQLGNNPMLVGVIPAGAAVQATAGFQVPESLEGDFVLQATRADDGGQVQVRIGFGQDAAESSAAVVIALQGAEVSMDGTSLLLNGEIANLGQQSVVVDENEVALTGNGTVFLMQSTNPGFPWVVSAGQTLPYTLSFQRPDGSSAVFSVLNQSFQLEGLR